MVRVYEVFLRDAFEQFALHIEGRFTRRQAGSVSEAKQVGIHSHRRLTKRHVQHHIRSLATYAREGFKCFTGSWNLSAMQIHQHVAGLEQVPGFTAK
jgi:hypothetical protein